MKFPFIAFVYSYILILQENTPLSYVFVAAQQRQASMTEYLTQWHEYIMDADRIPEMLIALVLTVIIGMISGPLAGNANPFFWVMLDSVFGKFGERLDRTHRAKADLMFRGFVLSAIVIVLTALVGQGFHELSIKYPAYEAVTIILLALLFTSGSVWFALLRLYFAMEHKKVVEGSYYAIARSTRVNLAAGDDYGTTRAAMGLAARSFDKGLIAPALWYLIGGFPAVCIYSGLSMLAWRFGKNGLGTGFGAVPLALERLMGFIPAMFSALSLTLASLFTPTAKLHKGIAAWLGHKNRAPYEQGGFPPSALAWGLNISIGGAVQDLSGSALKGEWVGPEGATAQLDHKHLRRGIYINVMAHILFVASLLGVYMWAGILEQ